MPEMKYIYFVKSFQGDALGWQYKEDAVIEMKAKGWEVMDEYYKPRTISCCSCLFVANEYSMADLVVTFRKQAQDDIGNTPPPGTSFSPPDHVYRPPPLTKRQKLGRAAAVMALFCLFTVWYFEQSIVNPQRVLSFSDVEKDAVERNGTIINDKVKGNVVISLPTANPRSPRSYYFKCSDFPAEVCLRDPGEAIPVRMTISKEKEWIIEIESNGVLLMTRDQSRSRYLVHQRQDAGNWYVIFAGIGAVFSGLFSIGAAIYLLVTRKPK